MGDGGQIKAAEPEAVRQKTTEKKTTKLKTPETIGLKATEQKTPGITEQKTPGTTEQKTPETTGLKTIGLDDDNHELFQRVAKHFYTGRRLVVVTGAGISVSSGIPDFRSAGGLYERVNERYLKTSQNRESRAHDLKGKDFFDVSTFSNENSRPLFYQFIAELKELCDQAEPTETHRFLGELVRGGRVLRWYTQNIDGLEARAGLPTSMETHEQKGKGGWQVPVVGLHGTLSRLVCTHCHYRTAYQSSHHEAIRAGLAPLCPACEEKTAVRAIKGQRKVKGGIMRPDIVLYNEPHPQAEIIGDTILADISKRPTTLLVIGTSLRVVGLKRMVKNLAKAVHTGQAHGMAIFVNKTPVPRAEWKSVFDYELLGECDLWTARFRREFETIQAAQPVPRAPSKKDANLDAFFRSKMPVRVSRQNKSTAKVNQDGVNQEGVRQEDVHQKGVHQ